jgi:hypothetical protein
VPEPAGGGRIEAEQRQRRLVEGIPIADGVRRELSAVARDLGLEFD